MKIKYVPKLRPCGDPVIGYHIVHHCSGLNCDKCVFDIKDLINENAYCGIHEHFFNTEEAFEKINDIESVILKMNSEKYKLVYHKGGCLNWKENS